MERPVHEFGELFAQLGLPSDADDIDAFLRSHAGQLGTASLHEAPFWRPAQAQLLQELLQADADWALVVDRLSQALRSR